MHVVGSIIARLGSKRLKYKNLMPFEGKPLVGDIDICTLEDLLKNYRLKQGEYPEGKPDFSRAKSVQEEGLSSR